MARPTGGGAKRERREAAAASDEVLWAKYLDYCSARVCELFMELEEEQVFELARTAEREAGAEEGALSFREIAALLVEKLLDHLPVPDFETWAESYRRNPEKYDPHLLGLWRSAIESHATEGRS